MNQRTMNLLDEPTTAPITDEPTAPVTVRLQTPDEPQKVLGHHNQTRGTQYKETHDVGHSAPTEQQKE